MKSPRTWCGSDSEMYSVIPQKINEMQLDKWVLFKISDVVRLVYIREMMRLFFPEPILFYQKAKPDDFQDRRSTLGRSNKKDKSPRTPRTKFRGEP